MKPCSMFLGAVNEERRKKGDCVVLLFPKPSLLTDLFSNILSIIFSS